MTPFRYALLCSLAPLAASAAPLTVVNVAAPAINCVFNVSCTVTVTDSIGNFTLSGDVGTGRLQSRTFPGAPPAPAAGQTGYDYRVDMTAMKGATADNCVTSLRLDFGPAATLNYKPGVPSQLFVITTGGLGSVGVASADLTAAGILTVKFAAGGVCPGATSYFFGLAAKGAPVKSTASLGASLGGSVGTDARTPKH
ncbi:MAG: hypothetical protein JOZ72_19365 [Alphaproteobacteria bacterium]|nr:hypothetical protein [Alphaproteobacteria bacterium]